MRKVNKKIKADKKAKLDKEQWNAALDQLESKGFLTRVFDPDSGELINRPTKAGVDTYRCILAFYETDHLFNGPRVDISDITDEEMIAMGRHLYKMGLVHVYYDSETGDERFALGQKGWELMSVYADCVDRKSRNLKVNPPSDKGLKLATYIIKFMKGMNKVGKMAQKFEKSSGGSPRFNTAGMSDYGNAGFNNKSGKRSKGSKKRRKVGSDTEFWR